MISAAVSSLALDSLEVIIVVTYEFSVPRRPNFDFVYSENNGVHYEHCKKHTTIIAFKTVEKQVALAKNLDRGILDRFMADLFHASSIVA